MKTSFLKERYDMKRIRFIQIFAIILIIFIIAEWIKPIRNMNYVENIDIDKLVMFNIEKPEDMDKTTQLNNLLPANISLSGMGMAWENNNPHIDISYDYYGGNFLQLKKLERYWDNNKKKILLFNATTYLILTPKAKEITIDLQIPTKQRFEVTRTDLESFYGRSLDDYYKDITLWDKEVIKETVNSHRKLKEFFLIHPIQDMK